MKKIFMLLVLLVSGFALGATTTPVQLINPSGSTSGQAIVSTGPSTAPAWGSVSAASLAPVAANTAIVNATGATASPTAFVMPSCSTSASALNWTANSGYTCNTSVNAATLGGATFAAPGAIGGTAAGSGAFTTITASGTITPSQTAGIVGTTTNNNANVGSIGEYVSSTNSGGTNVPNATATNIASISLTAGDWDVSGVVNLASSGSNMTNVIVSISTTSNSNGPLSNAAQNSVSGSIVTSAMSTPVVRISVSTTTTVYLVGFAAFPSSTVTGTGVIRARRVR